MYNVENILNEILKIRKEIKHDPVNINIKKLFFDSEKCDLWIIAEDRVDKSAIIGKGGWVVGKLKESLKVNNIHVESYEDYLVKKYKLKLSYNVINNFYKSHHILGIKNLIDLIKNKFKNVYINRLQEKKESKTNDAIVALSGGVDSSYSLIIAKKLGFNPIAITINPGSIILPKEFKNNINKLVKKLNVKHEYIDVNFSKIIEKSLNGKYHPCGKCSKAIEDIMLKEAKSRKIPIVIFGDMLSTGSQSISKKGEEVYRLNLPASLTALKQDIKEETRKYGLDEFDKFGCPLLYEVHKKYPHMKKFSIQRILRETRTTALEPGEALDLIWSFYRLE